jgi:alginate O-acetyltransferase complex protein AlgI
MLFNSYIFIFLFLPIAFCIYYLLGYFGRFNLAKFWFIIASLFFYGWWNPIYIWLLLFSIAFNYSTGKAIHHFHNWHAKLFMILGIVGNLGLLGYFKYANFFINDFITLTGINFYFPKIILPLAISFFTFEQIGYLVDTWRKQAPDYKFLDYCVFVTFFPRLIAGPIIRHYEVLPQILNKKTYLFKSENLSVGISLFYMGLFKKVILADYFGTYTNHVFNGALAGNPSTIIGTWIGMIAFSLQIYFDFSAYSDMATGLARMFGITLPMNFFSPLKATSIFDFWRRWHITLMRFLRDYLFIPLVDHHKGWAWRYVSLFITMLLCGLWHGANWTFIVFGGLHGTYMIINHLWRHLTRTKLFSFANRLIHPRLHIIYLVITYFSVLLSITLFRAANLQVTFAILKTAFGFNGTNVPTDYSWYMVLNIILGLTFVWTLPNTLQIMANFKPTLDFTKRHFSKLKILWQPKLSWALFIVCIGIISILFLGYSHAFIYFAF